MAIEKKTETGVEKSIIEANLLVSAIGSLSIPAYANIEGRDRFKGIQFHSSRWDHSIDLKGKKVGVIGNGCSAYVFSFYVFFSISLSFTEYKLYPQ